jgi:transmembrane sensor
VRSGAAGNRRIVSNIVEFPDQTDIEAAARKWLIRLDGDAALSAAEIAALREWSARSPAHRAELKRLSKFWGSANVLTQLAVPLQRPRGGLALGGVWRDASTGGRVAAGLALVCLSLTAVLWWRSAGIARNGVYATSIGQQQKLALVDGSSMQINTDSQVRVEYEDHVRKIRLLRGEAFFTVAPNVRRPFLVFAASNVVRAVGTAFAVRLQGSDVDVTVTHGQVDVGAGADAASAGAAPGGAAGPALPTRRVSLKAGQTASFAGMGTGVAAADLRELSEPELRRRLSWHEGYLVFTGQPLGDVVAEVNRYSSVTLEIADPKLASLAIGGRFKVGDLEAVCGVLQSNFGIQTVRTDDQHIQLRAAPHR